MAASVFIMSRIVRPKNESHDESNHTPSLCSNELHMQARTQLRSDTC